MDSRENKQNVSIVGFIFIMKKLLLALPCALLLLTSSAQAADGVALKTGTYSLLGSNPGSDTAFTYKGSVTIANLGSNYSVQWDIGEEQVQKGIGILSGDVLSVSYYDTTRMQAGVVSYRLTQENQMIGQWAGYDQENQGQEWLTWEAPLSE